LIAALDRARPRVGSPGRIRQAILLCCGIARHRTGGIALTADQPAAPEITKSAAAEENHMRKSILMCAAAASLPIGAALLISMPSRDAAAQSSDGYINIVDLNIKPADLASFLVAAKENAAASVKDPGCREFNIVVSRTDPNNVVFFEVYDNEAALDVHRATDHYKKYQAAAASMVASRNLKAMAPIALNSSGH
jgi:(4S)-4-hydroxy-5-phosphonooxypentane-2,3-dione isomerase